jgi:L-rhamnose-H+ transport protein
MLSGITPILPIIIAGLMNGSFVIPAKYIPSQNEKIWLYHSVIGLGIIPWLILAFLLPNDFQHYFSLPVSVVVFVIASGVIFGLGQIAFANAIDAIGIALSFAINLGIGLTIGSMFVVFYKSAFFTDQGLLVTLAILLILSSLILYYHAAKLKDIHKINDNHKFLYAKGWTLASLTGITSGLQNITFFLLVFHTKTQFQTNDSFWVWPPFLLAAAIPMFFGFRHKLARTVVNKPPYNNSSFLNFRNLILIILMGLFFTGSLAIYSKGMTQLTHLQQIIGWPAFIVSIIFASQVWGLLYKENVSNLFKNKLYKFFSLILLVVAVILLASQA